MFRDLLGHERNRRPEVDTQIRAYMNIRLLRKTKARKLQYNNELGMTRSLLDYVHNMWEGK